MTQRQAHIVIALLFAACFAVSSSAYAGSANLRKYPWPDPANGDDQQTETIPTGFTPVAPNSDEEPEPAPATQPEASPEEKPAENSPAEVEPRYGSDSSGGTHSSEGQTPQEQTPPAKTPDDSSYLSASSSSTESKDPNAPEAGKDPQAITLNSSNSSSSETKPITNGQNTPPIFLTLNSDNNSYKALTADNNIPTSSERTKTTSIDHTQNNPLDNKRTVSDIAKNAERLESGITAIKNRKELLKSGYNVILKQAYKNQTTALKSSIKETLNRIKTTVSSQISANKLIRANSILKRGITTVKNISARDLKAVKNQAKFDDGTIISAMRGRIIALSHVLMNQDPALIIPPCGNEQGRRSKDNNDQAQGATETDKPHANDNLPGSNSLIAPQKVLPVNTQLTQELKIPDQISVSAINYAKTGLSPPEAETVSCFDNYKVDTCTAAKIAACSTDSLVNISVSSPINRLLNPSSLFLLETHAGGAR